MPAPYVPYIPYAENGGTLRDLVLHGGYADAERERRRGQRMAEGIGRIGEIASGAIKDVAAAEEKKAAAVAMAKRDAAWTSAVESWDGKDPKALYGVGLKVYGDPKTAQMLTQGVVSFHAMRKGDETPDHVFNVAAALASGKITPPMWERLGPGIQETVEPVLHKTFGAPRTSPEEQARAAERDPMGMEAQKQPWSYEQAVEGAKALMALRGGGEAPKTREIRTRNADGSESIQIVEDKPGFSATSAAPEPKKHMVTVPGQGGPVAKMVTEAELTAGVPTYVKPDQGPRPEFQWVQKDGEWKEVPKGAAPPGWKPASTREQGRPVTSGDAQKIADFDTSLDDLNALAGGLTKKGATGTGAAIGAAAPNWVTSLTGFGTDDKKTQAVIDRVKQVIGKTFEGGVLRKEDEAKYEKILPTISDSPAVVASKLDGLWAAVTQRRQTHLDSLGDAGYETTRYSERPQREKGFGDGGTPRKASGPKMGERRTQNGQELEWDGKGWFVVD